MAAGFTLLAFCLIKAWKIVTWRYYRKHFEVLNTILSLIQFRRSNSWHLRCRWYFTLWNGGHSAKFIMLRELHLYFGESITTAQRTFTYLFIDLQEIGSCSKREMYLFCSLCPQVLCECASNLWNLNNVNLVFQHLLWHTCTNFFGYSGLLSLQPFPLRKTILPTQKIRLNFECFIENLVSKWLSAYVRCTFSYFIRENSGRYCYK